MNRYDALGRELMTWFDETAMPRRPDYTTEIIQSTAAVRQRRWMSLERWFPMNVVEFRRRTFPPFPWRTAAVLVALLALLVAGLVYVGSQPRVPPPFGLAGNGLVAYAKEGDIFTVDPATGSRRWITAGDDYDETPRWSLDGTRIAFLRATRPEAPTDRGGGRAQRVMIADRERNVVAESIPIVGVDVDAFAWSPDGRLLALAGDANFIRVLFIVDTADGGVRPLDVRYDGLDFYWRPGDARQLLLRGETADGIGLVVADVDDPGSARLVAADGDQFLRPNGWTPDGNRIVYTSRDPTADSTGPALLRVLDLTTEAFVDIDAGYADVSNDGTRLLAIDPDGRPCIASPDGGPCVAIADATLGYDATWASGTFWTPDDRSILVATSDNLTLLDPAGSGTVAPPSWLADGAESWQRVAR